MKTKTKVIVGCVVVFLAASTIYGLTTGKTGSAPAQTPPTVSTPAATTPAPQETSSAAASEPTAQVDPETVKANAIEADNQLWQIVLSIERTNTKLGEALQGDDFQAMTTEAANAKDYQSKYHTEVMNIQCEGINTYSAAVQTYATACKDVATKTTKYLEKKEQKQLTAVEEAVAAVPAFVEDVNTERLAFLKAAGLTDEEIKAIIEG